jgi:hypothetical protein
MVSRTLITTIQKKEKKEKKKGLLLGAPGKAGREMVFATAMFAVKRSPLSTDAIRRRWLDYPQLQLSSREEVLQGELIQLGIAWKPRTLGYVTVYIFWLLEAVQSLARVS